MLRLFSFHSFSFLSLVLRSSLLHCKTVKSSPVHILANYVDNMYNRVHIFKETDFNMHIYLIKIEKAAKRTVK